MSSKNTPAKQPQDRLPKNEDQMEIEGFDLLKSPRDVKGSDQLRIINKLKSLGILNGDGEAAKNLDFMSMDLEVLADFVDYLEEKFALDPDEFAKFTTGPKGMERAIELAIAYANALGEGASS